MPEQILLTGDRVRAGALLPYARALLRKARLQQRFFGGQTTRSQRVGDSFIQVTAGQFSERIQINGAGATAALYFMEASPSLGDATSAVIYSALSGSPGRKEVFSISEASDPFLFSGDDTYLRLSASVPGAISVWGQDSFWAVEPVEALYRYDGTLLQAATVIFDAPEFAADYTTAAIGKILLNHRDNAALSPLNRTGETDRAHLLTFAFEKVAPGPIVPIVYIGVRDPATMFHEPSGLYDQSWTTLLRATYGSIVGGLQLWGGPSSGTAGWWLTDHTISAFLLLPFEVYATRGAVYALAWYVDATDTVIEWGLIRIDLVTRLIYVAATEPYGTTTGFRIYDTILESSDEFEFGYVLAPADPSTDGQGYQFYINGGFMFGYDTKVLNAAPAPSGEQECHRFWRVATGVYAFILGTVGVPSADRQYDVIATWSAAGGVKVLVQSQTPKERIIVGDSIEYGELGPWVAFSIFDGATLTSGKLQLVNVLTGELVVTDHDADGGNSRAIMVSA